MDLSPTFEPFADSPPDGPRDGGPDVRPDGGPDEPATTSDQDEAATRELLDQAARWDQAIMQRNEAEARQVLTAGFALEMVEPVRSVMARDVWLEMLPDYVVHEWAVEEQIVDVDGDVAAVFKRVRMRATVMGEDRSGVYVLTDLWRRDGGEWLVWRRQSTTLSPGRLPTTKE